MNRQEEQEVKDFVRLTVKQTVKEEIAAAIEAEKTASAKGNGMEDPSEPHKRRIK